ncbi:GNAT family N-acetyltransferase [Allorhizocola rhizosphaerae]|uniref:GNAT family N-acetyltransferase n=1 Tax=Allorhizocola rhizosphaerae TaxID=1872709 RepID=UPI000E3CD648|nr:GNAT family N-acetyltransferase [Allorhizocola rhizosphaerae]
MSLLDLYDAQLRTYDALDGEWDGPVFRKVGGPGGGFVGYRDVSGVEDLDALIVRERDFFAARGERVEWKYHSHDLPADLPDRLRANGFVPEAEETVLIGEAALMTTIPAGSVPVRETSDPADFARIGSMKAEVYGRDMSWVPQMLEQEHQTGLRVFVAELEGRIASAAWLRFVQGTEFAGLWGGATLKEYRGRGIYKALVAHRARLAVAHGYKYLYVDASDDSSPILQRLGFQAVTKTTPYVFTPAQASRGVDRL